MRRVLFILCFAFLIGTLWYSLTIGEISGPPGNPDSMVRNILYAHVPSSMFALLCFVVLLVASIGYLVTGKIEWDNLAAACGEVGAVFATVSNVTGMIFSRAEWNTWWDASPRLITTAILWFLYIVYLILRNSLPGSVQKRARICAVFGIIGFLDVPMVLISARMMDEIHRPKFLGDPSQKLAFWMSVAAVVFLGALLLWLKTDILKARSKLEAELNN